MTQVRPLTLADAEEPRPPMRRIARAIVQTVPAGLGPHDVVPAGGGLWVTEYGSDTAGELVVR